MSLHQIAKHVQSKGRGRDTMLVHMSPREVAGLQALAMAHGGKLSINPDTGLPEAGFLEQVLPVVAAGALTYFTAGAAAPFVAQGLGISTAAGGLLAGAGIGALVGGGMSSMQGGDFGRGALMGGIGGALGGYGAGGGFEGLFGSTAPTIDPVTGSAVEGSAIATQGGTAAAPSVTAPPPVTSAPGGTFAPPVPTFEAQQAAMAAQQAQMAQAGTLQSGLDLGGVGASPAAMASGSSVPLAVSGAAPAAATAPGMSMASKAALGLGGLGLLGSLADRGKYGVPAPEEYTSPLSRISPEFRGYEPPRPNPYYQARYPVYGAEGGVVALANGGPVERMSMMNTAMNPQGGLYPQGMIDKTQYATPTQRPVSSELVETEPAYQRSNPMLMAKGGISTLGDYSDGGRLLKGPGDGVSDDIPAQIGQRQPARLADGEFVVPARIVSEIGNGSTDAGARKLYAMMDRVQKARRKSMGKGRHAVDSKAEKLLPV
jgi:hypothetical protein